MKNQSNSELNQKVNQELNKFGHIIFWLLWTLSLILIPIYIFTFLFEIDKVQPNITSSYLAPIIGGLVIILQIAIYYISFKQMRQKLTLSRPYLTLLGGTIVIAFIWIGGCSVMGPWRFAG